MGKEIDWEIRERAEEMYVVDGLTFEEVARQTGVSVTQLKNWSGTEGWREKREEYRAARKNIRSTVMTLRQNLAKKAVNDPDPQNIYAFIRLETLAGKQERRTEDTARVDIPSLFLEHLEFIASVLKEKDPEGLKVLAGNFDSLIEAFKVKHAQAT